jgi:hypothetical protein
MLHILLSPQEAYFLANLRGLPVSCFKAIRGGDVCTRDFGRGRCENLSGAISWLTFSRAEQPTSAPSLRPRGPCLNRSEQIFGVL